MMPSSDYIPPHMVSVLAEAHRTLADIMFPPEKQEPKRIGQVTRIKPGEEITFVLGDIERNAWLALQRGGTIRESIPADVVTLLLRYRLSWNGLSRQEGQRLGQMTPPPEKKKGLAGAIQNVLGR